MTDTIYARLLNDNSDAAYLLRVLAAKIQVASEHADRGVVSHAQAALDDVLSLLRVAGVPM